jgi:hypothetical protein
MRARILAGVALVALFGSGMAARADDDPPARVGRLADLSGAVSLRTDPNQPWAVAARNQPITSGMSFWTEPQARAEFEIGPTELHLGDQAELDIQKLDDQSFAAQLGQGSVNLDIGDMQPGETYTVDTPRGTVTLVRPGEYRIDAGTTQDPTQVVVFSGEAQIAGGPDGPVDIQGGETGLANGADPFSFSLARSADRSPLDDWADGRLRAVAPAPRYVSRAMTGYQDLDGAGTWHEAPNYGTVWYPSTVPSGWVPYRDGHWQWEGRWGWTWVDAQPWGFAPFHYGRWAYVDDRWGWLPGPVEVRPVYAPALVTFFSGVAVGAVIGAALDNHPIGWYPLGPGEIYRPSYRVSDTYVRNVNVTNVRNITVTEINNIHNGPTIIENGANRRFATEVPERVLAEHQPVGRAALQVPPEQFAKAQLTPVSALPHPAAPVTGAQQAPHPEFARGPGGRPALAAADPNRPHAPAPSQPATPFDRKAQAPGAPGAAPAQPEGHPPLAGAGEQHGPAAPATAQEGPGGKPGPAGPLAAAPGQPHPPLPGAGEHGPAAPGTAQEGSGGKPGPAGPLAAAPGQAQGHPPLPERGQRAPGTPGGPAAAQAAPAQPSPGQPENRPGSPLAAQQGHPPLPERGQHPAGAPTGSAAGRPPVTAAPQPTATVHPAAAGPSHQQPPARQVIAHAPAQQPVHTAQPAPVRQAAAPRPVQQHPAQPQQHFARPQPHAQQPAAHRPSPQPPAHRPPPPEQKKPGEPFQN